MAELLGAYFLATKVRNPMLKSVGKVAFIVEGLGLADSLVSGTLLGGGSANGAF